MSLERERRAVSGSPMSRGAKRKARGGDGSAIRVLRQGARQRGHNRISEYALMGVRVDIPPRLQEEARSSFGSSSAVAAEEEGDGRRCWRAMRRCAVGKVAGE